MRLNQQTLAETSGASFVRLKSVLMIVAVIALPIAAEAGNKVASGHKVETALSKTKGQSAAQGRNAHRWLQPNPLITRTRAVMPVFAHLQCDLFLMCIACSLDLSMGNNKGDGRFRQGRECPIPFGGKRCPVKHCAAPTATNRLHLLHAE
jgi:hypothetical protein